MTTTTKPSGTRWQTLDAGSGAISLQCMGTGQGNRRFLDGNTGDGSVTLTKDTDPSGARWFVQSTDLVTISLECLGTGSGSNRYLDGNTGDASVNVGTTLAPTGARWTVYVPRGQTTHFSIFFDESLGPLGPKLADALLATCEADYVRLQELFGNVGIETLPVEVYIRSGNNGALHYSDSLATIYCDAFNALDADLVRYLLIAELSETLMADQGIGWDPGASNGEALSRILAAEFYPKELSGFATAFAWLSDPSRPNWVDNTESTDTNPVSTGCGALFINWLRFQLGFSLEQIIAAGQSTLGGTYHKLTNRSDGFLRFAAVLAGAFPPGPKVGLANDNPFPILPITSLVPGMTVNLWCGGTGSGGHRYLDGDTTDGSMTLTNDTTPSGTRWQVLDGGGGTIILQCLGTGSGSYRFLDGNTGSGAVGMTKDAKQSGTRWTAQDPGDGTIILKCMGTGSGANLFLDGNTGSGNVNVASDTKPSGTRWMIFLD